MARSFSETGHVRAQAKFVRSSSRKARLVLDHVRGLTVPQAKAILEFSTRDIARDIELVLRSAAHNAEVNHGLDSTRMVVHAAYADEGTTMKRFKPRARGRASKILKRTTHITIVLAPLAAVGDAAGRAGRGGSARGRGDRSGRGRRSRRGCRREAEGA